MEIKAETMKRCELITVTGRVDSSTAASLAWHDPSRPEEHRGQHARYHIHQQCRLEGLALSSDEGPQDDSSR